MEIKEVLKAFALFLVITALLYAGILALKNVSGASKRANELDSLKIVNLKLEIQKLKQELHKQ